MPESVLYFFFVHREFIFQNLRHTKRESRISFLMFSTNLSLVDFDQLEDEPGWKCRFLMAHFLTVSLADKGNQPVITGRPSFTMPAFSWAISCKVSPKIWQWSREMVVMTEISDLPHLLNPNAPALFPKWQGHFCFANSQNATAVIISKKEGCILWHCSSISSAKGLSTSIWAKISLERISPFLGLFSRSTKWEMKTNQPCNHLPGRWSQASHKWTPSRWCQQHVTGC